MLRAAVLLFGIVLLLGGALAVGNAVVPGWSALVLGGLIVIGLLAERVVYKPLSHKPAPGWQRTGERFVDDATGKVVEVFYDPTSGQRQYVQRD